MKRTRDCLLLRIRFLGSKAEREGDRQTEEERERERDVPMILCIYFLKSGHKPKKVEMDGKTKS